MGGSGQSNMKVFSALLSWILIKSLGLAAKVEIPKVKIVDCKKIPSGVFDKCLSVKFSYVKEYAGLKAVGSPNVLVGKLYGTDGKVNQYSRVSASFETKSDLYVVIHDPSDDELYKLKVDLVKGSTEQYLVSHKGGAGFDLALDPPHQDRFLEDVPQERQSQMPAAGFRMTVQPMVDRRFRNHFGKGVHDKVNAILEHARTFFTHASLQTKFELEYKPLHFYPGEAYATNSDLNALGNHVLRSGLPLVNSYVLLTMNNNRTDGTSGLAWKSTVCRGDKSYRVNINEFYYDTVRTTETVIHEIGHNLGMGHDFDTPKRCRDCEGHCPGCAPSDNPRHSSTGQPCTSIGGYMDYVPNPNRWSACSVEDLTRYYNKVRPLRYEKCMTKLSTSEPTNPTNPTIPKNCPFPEYVGNGLCNTVNNVAECKWDGGDCCNNDKMVGGSPWWYHCHRNHNDCNCKDPNQKEVCRDKEGRRACRRARRRGYCKQISDIPRVKYGCRRTCRLCKK